MIYFRHNPEALIKVPKNQRDLYCTFQIQISFDNKHWMNDVPFGFVPELLQWFKQEEKEKYNKKYLNKLNKEINK